MFTRPPAFEYKNGKLHCERFPLDRLAEKYGTPLYVYSATAIRERYRIFDRAFRGTPHTICYSVKANSNLGILRLLAKLGAGYDIVSGGELERVRLASKSAVKKVVFSGVGKTSDELTLALKSGILLFNVESEGELELLAECAGRLRKSANVALRVNPDVPAETHPYISTGLHEHKFGVPIQAAGELYRRAAGHHYLKIAGVSLHIGSQITDVSPFAIAVQRAAELVRQLASDGHRISFLDVGGGLGISYRSSHPIHFPDLIGAYADAITSVLRQLGKWRPHLLLEPGRSIIAPAGALLTRALYGKRNGNKHFTIVDAAMNDLIRPALYGAKHEITPVSWYGSTEPRCRNQQNTNHYGAQPPSAATEESSQVDMILNTIHSDVVGPVCESGDFLARDAVLPATASGEYLCILDAGAYGMSLASNYNTRARAAEVLVEGAKARLVRRRETIKDLLQPELACL